MVSSCRGQNLYLNKSTLSDCSAPLILSRIHGHPCKIWQWFTVTWRWQVKVQGLPFGRFDTPETGKVYWKEVVFNWYPQKHVIEGKVILNPPHHHHVQTSASVFVHSLIHSLLQEISSKCRPGVGPGHTKLSDIQNYPQTTQVQKERNHNRTC
jgi:hypothetical protein